MITQSGEFMGPALERVFAALGATLITDLRAPGAQIDLAAQIVADAARSTC